MKKNFFLPVCVAIAAGMTTFTACQQEKKQMAFQDLPQDSQAFISLYFTPDSIKEISKDSIEINYEVTMLSGDEITFGPNGQWMEVDMEEGAMPMKVFEQVPDTMMKYIKANFPGVPVKELSKDNNGYKVKLKSKPATKVHFDLSGILKETNIEE